MTEYNGVLPKWFRREKWDRHFFRSRADNSRKRWFSWKSVSPYFPCTVRFSPNFIFGKLLWFRQHAVMTALNLVLDNQLTFWYKCRCSLRFHFNVVVCRYDCLCDQPMFSCFMLPIRRRRFGRTAGKVYEGNSMLNGMEGGEEIPRPQYEEEEWPKVGGCRCRSRRVMRRL